MKKEKEKKSELTREKQRLLWEGKKMLSSTIEYIKEEMCKYPINKMIFWVGAGIDRDNPTALPLGNELTIEILNRACGNDTANKLLEQWQKTADIVNCVSNNDINISTYPRLETVMEGIRIFESKLSTGHTILNGLKSFKDAPPNINHYILAELLHQGANIVTTNYDSCISKAYNNLYEKYNYSMKLNDENNIYIFESNYSGAGKIYYIHGIAQHVENIGATLSIVKNPIAKEFTQKMSEWIDMNSCFIYLGYGGVDSLDINPYLRSLKRSNVSTGIYIRHSNLDNEKNIVMGKDNEMGLISCFNKGYIVYYNTNEFLKILINKETYYNLDKENYIWIDNYDKYCKLFTSQLQKQCVLGILFLLNLNPNFVLGDKWIEFYKNNMSEDINNWFLGYYGFQNCVRCNKIDQIPIFISFLEKNSLLKSDIKAAQSKYLGFIKELWSIHKIENNIINKILNNEVIGWDISTPINHSTIFLLYILSNSFIIFKIVKKIYRRKIYKLMEILKLILNTGSFYVVEINQINVACLNLGILELIINRNETTSQYFIERAKNNYIEVNSVSGIINSIFYNIIYCEMQYYYTRDEEYKIKSQNLYKQVNEIIEKEEYIFAKRKMISIVEKIGEKVDIYFGI